MDSLEQIFSRTGEHGDFLSSIRAYLSERREQIRGYHKRGASGAKVVGFLTAMIDEILHQAYRRALLRLAPDERDAVEENCLFLALGGYGRKELNPHSDIDLMFLIREVAEESVQGAAKEILHLLWDLGFTVGHSFRTIKDAVRISRDDYTTRTAMLESRILAGNASLYTEFQKTFRRIVERDVKGYLNQKVLEMKREHQEYGATVYLLEPNVKRSEGGLRDIHYIRWIAVARYGVSSLAQLHQKGILSSQDYLSLGQGQDFLWRVRNELHFHSGQATDILSFEEQERLAEFFGFGNTEHLLAVERFMQNYYIYTTRIHDISARFIDGSTSPPLVRRIFHRLVTRDVDKIYRLTPEQISFSSKVGVDELKNGVHLINLFLLSKDHGVRISEETLENIPQVLSNQKNLSHFDDSCGRFRLLLSSPGSIGKTLRAMHRTQFLWRFIPEYERIHRLVQFNRYHKYTVDEHSIRAVEEAEALARQHGPLSQVYMEIKRKDILHLALLLHDVGKGLAGDHSLEGVRIAKEVAMRLGLTDEETSLLLFLVEKHLTMSHIAFRRDLSDSKVLLLFAQEVRTPEVLRMLLILTYADIQAVGPGTWTSWKRELMLELYEKTLEELTGTPSPFSEEERVEEICQKVKERFVAVPSDISGKWLSEAFASMNRRYLLVTPIERIVRDLEMIHQLSPRSVSVHGENDSTTRTTIYTVYTFDDIIGGIFSKIAGVLAARGLQILDAQVDTRSNGVIVDTFRVSDTHYGSLPPPERLDEIKQKIVDTLLGRIKVEVLFSQKTRFNSSPRPIDPKPTTVEFDNVTSDFFSIIDIFAQDKQGLLYVITHTIFELDLSVFASKIATRLDQIVDVFYVQDHQGKKISDPARIQRIKERLIDETHRFLAEK